MKSKNDWHLIVDRDVLAALSVDMYKGLSESEASRRRRAGSNSVWRIKHVSAIETVASAVCDVATILLVICAVTAALFDKSYESGWIILLLLAASLMRSVTLIRAHRILEDAARAKIPISSVLREGRVRLVAATELVKGDIVLLESGDIVPADGRVLIGEGTVFEKGITENSSPVKKFNSVIKLGEGSRDVPCEFRSNMLFAGSRVLSGSIRMVLTASGRENLVCMKQDGIEIDSSSEIPSVERMKIRSRNTSLVMLVFVLVLTVISMFVGSSLPGVFLASMAMATASMSEFMTVIGYIITAVAVRDASDAKWRPYADKKYSVNRTVIRTPEDLDGIDKINRIYFCGTSFFKSGDAVISAFRTDMGYFAGDNLGQISDPEKSKSLKSLARLITYAQTAAMSFSNSLGSVSDISVSASEDSAQNSNMSMLSTLAAEHYARLSGKMPVNECTLADHRSRDANGSMGNEVSLALIDGDYYAIACGRINDILACCTTYECAVEDGSGYTLKELDFAIKKQIFTECARLETGGGRVVAVARRQSQFQNLARLPVITQYMTFVGYFALAEEEEPHAKENIAYIKESGIVPVMFSSSPETDLYYCRRLGLFNRSTKIVTPEEISAGHVKLNDGGLVVSLEGAEGMKYASRAYKIVKKLGGDGAVAVGRQIYDSGVLSEAQFGVTVARSSIRTVPETLAHSSSAVVYPESCGSGNQAVIFGGLDGLVRLLLSSRRVVNNFRHAKFYLSAAQISRLIVMFVSVLCSLPSLTAVFILIWGLLFDFAALLVMAFDNSFEKTPTDEKRDPIYSAVFGVVWGGLLSLTSFGVTKIVSDFGMCTSILASSVIFSSVVSAWVILRPVNSKPSKFRKGKFPLPFAMLTVVSFALAAILSLSEAGAKITSGSPCTVEFFLALIPAAIMLIMYFIIRVIMNSTSSENKN